MIRRVRRKHQARRLVSARGRSAGFTASDPEEEYWADPIMMVGSLASDWGPTDEPRQWPWSRKEQQRKPAFGFARALENE